MSKRSKLRNLFVFGGALKSTLNLVCRGVVDIHRTLNVLDQVLEVLISPVILSSIFFNVIVQIRGKTAVRSSRSHQQKQAEKVSSGMWRVRKEGTGKPRRAEIKGSPDTRISTVNEGRARKRDSTTKWRLAVRQTWLPRSEILAAERLWQCCSC